MNTINLAAYFATIKKKTGLTTADFRKAADAKGWMNDNQLKPEIKAMQVFDWLKDDYSLGRGHGMAVYHVLKEGINDY
ncbi:DUF4287 domain-containing protein [Mucilaginibacter corticis]|uniref:DUF4287 domain-containing protein n=1 Tax=Mucilaginibacter corticis TaxID=2597670 RepID=A0A556MME5_9SPHI|nr:DUF4287 domain-containing protein [Mucilaginibacter corticis]TSJ41045.1 DUF4287 domain-containing protein [Mucilaginibacter corticis]